jgi:ABC-type nitrate/sulfonate/bicarbonate transport system ATPase subunit
VGAPLELAGLTKTFRTPAGPVVAVQDVNATVHDGEFACILGHSGCGKSTVLSIIAGLEHATDGRVVIDGVEADGPGTDRAVVFQAPCLLPWLTVRENVALAIKQASPRSSRAERRAQIDRYLELVSRVLEFLEHHAGQSTPDPREHPVDPRLRRAQPELRVASLD